MPLIKNLEELLKYVVVDNGIDYNILSIFTAKAERKIKTLIGKEQYNEFVSMTKDDPVKELLTSAVAQLSLLYALPSLKLRITNSGIFTTDTSETRVPEWWEIRDLHNSLKNNSFSDVDEALKEMETDPTTYPKFIYSENYTQIKNLIITHAGAFQKYFNIDDSRLTYLALVPSIRECIDEYLLPWMGQCIYDIPNTSKGNYLLELLQKALVAFTVAKIAHTGSFSLTNNTLVVKWELMPWEKAEKISENLLENLKDDRFKMGTKYLNLAKKYVVDNFDDFKCLQDQINEQKSISKIFLRKSGIYLG